jgi:lysozyme
MKSASDWNEALVAADQEMSKWLGPIHKARIGVRGLRRFMNNFTYDNQGLALTEGFEGCRLVAYPDVRGIWTIGYGHTGADVFEGLVIAQPQAEALLVSDVAAAVACVNHTVTVDITQDEFDALVDFTFNAGRGAFVTSTLLRYVRAGNMAGAAAQFGLWVNAGGVKCSGLVRRRDAEELLFTTRAA